MADLYGGEVIHRVRAELVPHRRELKLYALCRCGSGAWLVSTRRSRSCSSTSAWCAA